VGLLATICLSLATFLGDEGAGFDRPESIVWMLERQVCRRFAFFFLRLLSRLEPSKLSLRQPTMVARYSVWMPILKAWSCFVSRAHRMDRAFMSTSRYPCRPEDVFHEITPVFCSSQGRLWILKIIQDKALLLRGDSSSMSTTMTA
jgi:hypothetical protein